MTETKFTYDDYRYLNILVTHINGAGSKLTVHLMPDVPEFIEAAKNARKFDVSSSIPEINERLKNKQFDHDTIRGLVMLTLCEKYNIRPFCSLRLDYRREIEYDIGNNSELNLVYKNPLWLAQNRKWYSIKFRDLSDENSIESAKAAIEEFIEQGYVVTWIDAKLNPRVRTGDHYFSYEEYESRLWACDGEIIITNMPDGFELPTVPLKIERRRKCIENFIEGFLEDKKEI